DPRGGDQYQKRPWKHEADRRGSAPRDFKYPDALAGVDGVLKHGASLLRRKMMIGREYRPEPRQFTRNSLGVNRVRAECDAIPGCRSYIFEGPQVREFICEPDLISAGISIEISRESQPGSS